MSVEKNSGRGTSGVSPARKFFAAFATVMLAAMGLVSMPSVATAAPNEAIVVDQVTVGTGSGANGQLVVGDKITVSGSWDASLANPQTGDTFTVGLPQELDIPADVPFNLTGPRPDGSLATWATCLATASSDEFVCTLTEEVEQNSEIVKGDFEFEVDVVLSDY
ncbi:MAG: Ig-like domain-containing protein [Leucobacter sp.]